MYTLKTFKAANELELALPALSRKVDEAGSVSRLEELQADPDTGQISEGYVCKHHIRWPHRCDLCDELAMERHQLEMKQNRLR